jgi:hypothetical protein
MGTGADTFPASDTKLAVVVNNITGSVVTHFDGTNHDAAMAIDTLIFQDVNNRP